MQDQSSQFKLIFQYGWRRFPWFLYNRNRQWAHWMGIIIIASQLNKKPSSKLGWPHQRENAVSDGVVSRDLDFEGLPIRIWS